jgi:periplasmic protein TonB
MLLPSNPARSTPARPSLRDQIASLGSGLRGDVGKLADQTISLNDPEPRYNDYLNHLKSRIQPVWYNLIRLRENVNPRTVGVGGQVHLVFTLNATGSLAYISLTEGSGFPMLDQEALDAVKGAAPFAPFPPQMGEKPFNIVASFHYNPYASRRP